MRDRASAPGRVQRIIGTPVGGDLAISKTDGRERVATGQEVAYTLEVTNDGAFDAVGARVVDAFPPELERLVWRCEGSGGARCDTPSGSGPLDQRVDLPRGGAIRFEAVGTVGAATTCPLPLTLMNTATISPPPDLADERSENDVATDVDTVLRRADLAVRLVPNRLQVTSGDVVVYRLIVSNAGPDAACGARFRVLLPPSLTASSVRGGSPAAVAPGFRADLAPADGGVSGTVDVPPNGSTVIEVSARVEAVTTCPVPVQLSVDASVALPEGLADPDPTNDAGTAAVARLTRVDLAIGKDDGVEAVDPGDEVLYVIPVSNRGPDAACAAAVLDGFPPELEEVAWTCAAPPPARCGAGASGDIDDLATVHPGTAVTYAARATVVCAGDDVLENTVTVEPSAGVFDSHPEDNSATDGDALACPVDVLVIPTLSHLALAFLAGLLAGIGWIAAGSGGPS